MDIKAALQAKLDELTRTIAQKKKTASSSAQTVGSTYKTSNRPNQWVRPGSVPVKSPAQAVERGGKATGAPNKKSNLSWKRPQEAEGLNSAVTPAPPPQRPSAVVNKRQHAEPRHGKNVQQKDPEPKRHRDNSAKEYLYGSVYDRSADGFKLVRSEPGGSGTPLPPPPPQTQAQTTSKNRSTSVFSSGTREIVYNHTGQGKDNSLKPGGGDKGGSSSPSHSSALTRTTPSTTTATQEEQKGSTEGGGGHTEDNMEEALKRARQHLAASGHIAKALAKRRALDSKPAKRQLAKQQASKAAKEQREAHQARAEARAKERAGGGKNKSKACSYFVRQGTCANGDRCQFMHDRNQVALCQPFLAASSQGGGGQQHPGCLLGDACPLSHDMSSHSDKMPVCTSFLQGSCVDPTCLYRHVKVNRQAQACPTFLRTGACDKGDECPLKHPSRIGRAPVMAPADVSLSDQHRHCT